MYRIFVDFDGTITRRDVGDSIFERFLRPDLLEAGWHSRIIEEWKAGRLSSRDCLVRECENTVVTRDELDALLDGHQPRAQRVGHKADALLLDPCTPRRAFLRVADHVGRDPEQHGDLGALELAELQELRVLARLARLAGDRIGIEKSALQKHIPRSGFHLT